MKISKREVILLFILAIVAMVYVGYMFLISPAITANNSKEDKYKQVESSLITVNTDQAIAGKIDEQLIKVYETAKTAYKPLSNSIEQSEIDRYFNTLISQNKLTQVSLDISELQASNANYNSKRVQTENSVGTLPLQQTADIINGANASANSQKSDTAKQTNTTNQASENTSDFMYCRTAHLVVYGSYNNIVSFMNSLYSSERTIIVDTLNISQRDDGLTFNATIGVRFFAAPEIK